MSITATADAAPAHRAALRSRPPPRTSPPGVHAVTPPPTRAQAIPAATGRASVSPPIRPAVAGVAAPRAGGAGARAGGGGGGPAASDENRDEQAQPEPLGYGDDHEHGRPPAGRAAERVGGAPADRGTGREPDCLHAAPPRSGNLPAPANYPLMVQLHRQSSLCW